jgi:hypothetical protein
MKNHVFSGPLVALCLVALIGCGSPFSESVMDESAGLNGGFETVKDGLPVNWLTYTANTTKDGDFDIVFDTDNPKEGDQALRFDIRTCSDIGGWASPGFTREIDVETGKTYRLSMWIKNDGCTFNVSAGGVSAMEGDMETVLESSDSGDWQLIEYTHTSPEEFDRLRFQVSITSPGTFWVDDVKVEELKE